MVKRFSALLLCVSVLLGAFSGCSWQTDKSHNTILSAEENKELIAERYLQTFSEPPALYINGVQAIYEESKKTYFYTVSADETWEKLNATLDGYETAYLTNFELQGKSEFLSSNRAVSLVAYNDTHYARLSVTFTTLPVMTINTMQLPSEYTYFDADEEEDVYYDEEGEPIPYEPYGMPSEDADKPIGEYNTFVQVTLMDPAAESHGYENGFTSMARAHIRGRSSRRYPKNSYKLELLKEENGVLVERDETLLGMRSDGDWNLNGMYAEPTKIRDKVASDLWLSITADRETNGLSTGYRCEYLEVIINGRYHGLYLLTERIDRKQLGLQDGDRLYFSEGDIGKQYTDFLECEDNEDLTISGYSLDWPKERSEPYDEWVPFGELTKLIDATLLEKFDAQAPAMIDEDSLADYEVFIQTATAVDNLIQNTFYIAEQQEDGSYVFSFLPWDMDQTFGNRWHGEKPLYTGEDYWGLTEYNAHFWVSDKMKARNAGDYRTIVEARYAALRETVISDKALIEALASANATVVGSGAFYRNQIRWPDGGYEDDPAAITEYVVSHMRFVDTLYKK